MIINYYTFTDLLMNFLKTMKNFKITHTNWYVQ